MIVICEECGKKYRIDTSKIKEKEVYFKCKSCNHVNRVINIVTENKEDPGTQMGLSPSPPSSNAPSLTEPETTQPAVSDPSTSEFHFQTAQEVPENDTETTRQPQREKPLKLSPQRRGIGIWFKMLVLFLVIPLVIIGLASYLYLQQLNTLSDLLIEESTGLVSDMSESIIAETGWFASSQAALYLKTHSDLEKESFNNESAFKRLIQKKIGLTGYTFLFSLSDENTPSNIWVHPQDNVIGQPLSEVMQKSLGRHYTEFEKILHQFKNSDVIEADGYFIQPDRKGKNRQKYIYMTPVEGTNFILAATTFIDEFTLPVLNLEKSARRTTQQIQHYIIGILIGMLVLVGLFVILYSHRLSSQIRSLTDAANRISVGELDEEIRATSGDEIGELADAISRMQDSIRLSIERLRKRR
jgi:predicted Zn finger-like uncharacterized protein